MRPLLLCLALLAACDDEKPSVDTGDTVPAPGDLDGDGWPDEEDCDDQDAGVNPGAEEICDGTDNDCDGEVDEDALGTWYTDADGDGFGDPASAVEACAQPEGTVPDGTDCLDTDAAVHPGALEVCNRVDDDCDGLLDEADPDLADGSTWYRDQDADGYGTDAETLAACEAPDGFSALAGDCDDTDPAFNPGAVEDDCSDPTDWNCDGSVGYADLDADGFAACEECDDADAAVNPAALEACNGLDDDCDGVVDEPDATDAGTWYADADGDGFGDPGAGTTGCEQPEGTVADATDCDDASASVYPGADEFCNSIDDDCDGSADEGIPVDAPRWHYDGDGDGYGDGSTSWRRCTQPRNWVADDTDCDDADADTYPGADERCDAVDNDCDGDVDEEPVDGTAWYLDDDCDGFGGGAATVACESPGEDWTDDGSDCDDADARAYVDAPEVCDGVDNDCGGTVDEDCEDAILVPEPSGDALDAPASPGACALVGETDAAWNTHDIANLDTWMDILDGTSTGLVASVEQAAPVLDWSARCGADASASPGNYDSTTPWPTLADTGTNGMARIRGYLALPCGATLDRTLGLLGNDALDLTIEGEEIAWVNWNDGQWKKFRYVSFPGPGLYAFEVRWSTNLICEIDPFELVWAEGFVEGYDEYDTMCAYASCTYGTGEEIPGFEIVEGDWLASASDGGATACAQCAADADCATGETCNTAGICE